MDKDDLCKTAHPMRVLVFALIAGAHACGPTTTTTTTTTTGTGQGPGEEPMNLSPGHNGLPALSLLSNAVTQNPKALQILIDNPLNSDLFDAAKQPYMSLQLTDRRARDVMEYIVSCALPPSSSVMYVEPSGEEHTWTGELGLCAGWQEGRPSESCLHLVSSCLFARTNRFGRQVPIRLAGREELQPRPGVEMTTRRFKGGVHAAFKRGWNPGYVGSCTPGSPITLSVPRSSNCSRTQLRVCRSILGCELKDARYLGGKHGTCDRTPVTFSCPDDGFYGVMTKLDRKGELEGVRADGGAYPAPEQVVFPFEEGAFFGNLFTLDGLTRFREVVREGGRAGMTEGPLGDIGDAGEDSIPYRSIYSCYALENAEEGVAYLSGRVCAKPDANKKCFPNPPQPCRFSDADKNAKGDAVCRKGTNGQWGCKGTDGRIYPALAVFLHEPCGFTESGCANLPKAPLD